MKNSAFFCAAALLFAACSADNDTATYHVETPLTITAGPATRAHNNLWDANDAIGVFMSNTTGVVADNAKYVTSSNQATAVFKPFDLDNTVYLAASGEDRSVWAYYPYDTNADRTYSVDVTDQSSLSAIDFMISNTVTVNKTAPTASLAFEHQLVKIEVNMQGGNGHENADLSGIEVAMTNQRTHATCDLLSEENQLVINAIGEAKTVTFNTNADGTKAEAILLPAASTADMVMEFTLGGMKYKFPMTHAANSSEFEAGKKYLYNIKINKTDLTVEATIVDWVAGNGVDGENGEAQ